MAHRVQRAQIKLLYRTRSSTNNFITFPCLQPWPPSLVQNKTSPCLRLPWVTSHSFFHWLLLLDFFTDYYQFNSTYIFIWNFFYLGSYFNKTRNKGKLSTRFSKKKKLQIIQNKNFANRITINNTWTTLENR